MPQGAQLGEIVACCQDESCCCVLVEKATWLRDLSQHSSQWVRAASPREFWLVEELVTCVAWKIEAGEITAIMM